MTRSEETRHSVDYFHIRNWLKNVKNIGDFESAYEARGEVGTAIS